MKTRSFSVLVPPWKTVTPVKEESVSEFNQTDSKILARLLSDDPQEVKVKGNIKLADITAVSIQYPVSVRVMGFEWTFLAAFCIFSCGIVVGAILAGLVFFILQ